MWFRLDCFLCLQLFAHPVFEAVEGLVARKLGIPDREGPQMALRVVVRVIYCGICAGLAMLLPFFNGDPLLPSAICNCLL